MTFKGIHKVFFLGIGGIGMSALARWFRHEGYPVAGYDKTPSPLTEELEKEGMQITFEDKVDTIPAEFTTIPEEVLVVWTPAIPKDSVLLNFFQAHYQLKKRSEVLGMITRDLYTIAVAGTHGKTSTSSLIAHLLKSAGKPVVAFLGGITQNYQSNLILPGKSKEEPIVVVEADEFDRSFLRLHPNEAVLTSADPDHLDIYGDESTILDGFRDFCAFWIKRASSISSLMRGIDWEKISEPALESVNTGFVPIAFMLKISSPDQALSNLTISGSKPKSRVWSCIFLVFIMWKMHWQQ